MIKKIICLSFFFIIVHSFAQEKTVIDNNSNEQQAVKKQVAPPYQRFWSFGGNLGLAFWNGGTDILLAPKAYYHVSPMFLTGFGVTYIYSDNNDPIFGYHSNSFGGSVFLGLRPIPFLQFSAEFEPLYTNRGGYNEQSYWINALYLGASFVSGNVSFGLRYDIFYDNTRSVYGSALNPVIGFYF
jgi:hypothetical protein